MSAAFKTPTTLREMLREGFPHHIPSSTDFQVGYLEGNTKCWIVEDRDLSTMYDSFDDGSKITLWCDGHGEGAVAGKSAERVNQFLSGGKLIARMYHHCLTQQMMKFTRNSRQSILIRLIQSRDFGPSSSVGDDMIMTTYLPFLCYKMTPHVVKRTRKVVCQMHWLTQLWFLQRHIGQLIWLMHHHRVPPLLLGFRQSCHQ